ncbi:CRISPR-associated protein Csx20 [Campylobacter sp. RM15925]|uniref:CRISPR-associated protein Csx20 n=1 Tax=Campylobacter sp. RM15925 TaxID=1705724 RepID=UPI0014732564|nr:CRISPR-associated protein Csx20 [Campylobacter sp. RM15925]
MVNKVKMILVFSHKLTTNQIQDAKEKFHVSKFVKIPKELLSKWSNMSPEIKKNDNLLGGFKNFIKTYATKNDLALVKGDFGTTYKIVNFCKGIGTKNGYSTTKSVMKENILEKQLVKSLLFGHIMFRESY